MIRIPFAAVLLTFAAPVLAAPSSITGRWIVHDGSSVVTISDCGGSLCGRVTKVLKAPPPGSPTTDINNPDPKLRSRSLMDVAILSGLKPDGDNWTGRIYDPKSGKSYRSVVGRSNDGTLKVQGCVSVICRTMTWKPAT